MLNPNLLSCLPFWPWAVLKILTYFVSAPVSPRCPACVDNAYQASIPAHGCQTLDLAGTAFAAVIIGLGRVQISLYVFRTVAGVLVVQSFDAELIGGEQVFQ